MGSYLEAVEVLPNFPHMSSLCSQVCYVHFYSSLFGIGNKSNSQRSSIVSWSCTAIHFVRDTVPCICIGLVGAQPPSSCRASSLISSTKASRPPVALPSRFWTAVLHVWSRAAAPVAVSLNPGALAPHHRKAVAIPTHRTSLCSVSRYDFDGWCVMT
jgi:hypothetical protein